MSVAETATPVAATPLRHPKVVAVVNPKGGAARPPPWCPSAGPWPPPVTGRCWSTWTSGAA